MEAVAEAVAEAFGEFDAVEVDVGNGQGDCVEVLVTLRTEEQLAFRGEAELAIRTAAAGAGATAQIELFLLSTAPGRRRAAPPPAATPSRRC